MKRLVGLLFLALGIVSAQAQERQISDVLGVTHMNSLYQFTNKPVLFEGADVIANMGASGIKLWFGPAYATNYQQNHQWDAPTNLTELAQTNYFDELFSDPRFTAYSLELATFDKHTAWKNGLTEAESAIIYQEIYQLTSHLLTRYAGTDKTFILQNWEGDNNLGQNASAVKVQGMIDWLKVRQQAISDASSALPNSNVYVYGAAECNKVGQPDWDGPRMVTDVFPHLQMDLYSYSNWFTREDPAKLVADLNRIKQFAPDSAAFGHENVFLGEFGNKRLVGGGSQGTMNEDANANVSQIELETGLDIGARYAFFWMAYDANQVKSHALVLDETTQQAFVPEADVDVTGRYYSKAYRYFRNVPTRLSMVEDNAEDLSLLASHSSNVTVAGILKSKFDYETGQFIRNTQVPASIIYQYAKPMTKIAIPTYQDSRKKNNITVEVSVTGVEGSYVDVPMTEIVAEKHEAHWQRILLRNQQPLLSGAKYMRITYSSNEIWSPRISAVRVYHDAPKTDNVVVFGSDASLQTDDGFTTLFNPHEIVEWSGVDSWGNDAVRYGTLKNAVIGDSLYAPATELKLEVMDITSQSTQKTFTSGGALGVVGGVNAKFDANQNESISVRFDKPITLKSLVLGGLEYNSEVFSVTTGGNEYLISNQSTGVQPAPWNATYKVMAFDTPLTIPALQTVILKAKTGQVGLRALVVEAQP